MAEYTSILIGGDTVPTQYDIRYFMKGDAHHLFKGFLSEFQTADLSLLNLECPLISYEQMKPIDKIGPSLGAEQEAINALKGVVDVIGLANNHIMDYGKKGIFNTIDICKKSGFKVVGAGTNLRKAQEVAIQECNGIRIAVMAVAEREFSIASEDSPGANPLDIINYVRYVGLNSHRWDYLIVLLHGGNEYYPYPSPRLQKVCRFLVEQGANAVIGQHTHCAGCYEQYKNATIVYGQGNLIFHKKNFDLEWNRGFLVRLDIDANLNCQMKLMPYYQSNNTAGIHEMNSREEKEFIEQIEQRSQRIKDENFVQSSWDRFSKDKKDSYLALLFLPQVAGIRWLNRKLHIVDKLLPYSRRKLLLNLIRCDSHLDVLKNILKKKS